MVSCTFAYSGSSCDNESEIPGVSGTYFGLSHEVLITVLVLLGLMAMAVALGLMMSSRRRQRLVRAWTPFCREIGAELVDPGLWWGDISVRAQAEGSTITVNIAKYGAGAMSVECTRISAVRPNRSGFRFMIGSRPSLGERSEVGYPKLDRKFAIKGNDMTSVQNLLASSRIRQLLHSLPNHLKFELKLTRKELRLQVPGIVTDIVELRMLFSLFVETLCQLGHSKQVSEGNSTEFI